MPQNALLQDFVTEPISWRQITEEEEEEETMSGETYHPFYHPDDRLLLEYTYKNHTCSFDDDGAELSYFDATIGTQSNYLSTYGVAIMSFLSVVLLGIQLRSLMRQHYGKSTHSKQMQLEIGGSGNGCIQALPNEFTVVKTNYAHFIICRRVAIIWYLLWFGIFSHLLLAMNNQLYQNEHQSTFSATGEGSDVHYHSNEAFENGGSDSIVDITGAEYWITRLAYACCLMGLPGLIIGIVSNQWLACINEYSTSKALAISTMLYGGTGGGGDGTLVSSGKASSTSSSSGDDSSDMNSMYTSENNTVLGGVGDNGNGGEVVVDGDSIVNHSDDGSVRNIRRTPSVSTISPTPYVLLLLTRQRKRHAFVSLCLLTLFTLASAFVMWITPTIVISNFYTKAVMAIVTLILCIVCTITIITKWYSYIKRRNAGSERNVKENKNYEGETKSRTCIDRIACVGGVGVGLTEQQKQELRQIQNEEFMQGGMGSNDDDDDSDVFSDVEDGDVGSAMYTLPAILTHTSVKKRSPMPSPTNNSSFKIVGVAPVDVNDEIQNNSNNNNNDTSSKSSTEEDDVEEEPPATPLSCEEKEEGCSGNRGNKGGGRGGGDVDDAGCSSLSLSSAVLFGFSQYVVLIGILIRYFVYPNCGSLEAYEEDCFSNCIFPYYYNHNFVYTLLQGLGILMLVIGSCCLPR